MKVRQAYKYRLRPDPTQERDMRRFAGARRFVWNKALGLQRERQTAGLDPLPYAALCRELTCWRHDPSTDWLLEMPIHPLQQTLKDLCRAFANHEEGRADPPKLKKKGKTADSFRYPDPKQFRLDQGNGRVRLPKLGWLRYRNSRPAPGDPKQATVSLSAGRWHVSVQTERDVPDPAAPSGPPTGMDAGIKRLAVLSDGTTFLPFDPDGKHLNAKRKAQKALSRKKRFSRNWRKAKAKLARIEAHGADARKDHLHKTSTTLSKTHALVAVEDLEVRNMSRSAKGTKEKPGRNVKAKSGLNRQVLNQGWGELRRQLEYKCAREGGEVVAVPPAYTSRTCPNCGYESAGNRPKRGIFRCLSCGFEADADRVGAINVLRRAGHARIACVFSGGLPRRGKQEPAEVSAHD